MPQKKARKILAKNTSQPNHSEPSFQTKVGFFQFLDILALTSVFEGFFLQISKQKAGSKIISSYRDIAILRYVPPCTLRHLVISRCYDMLNVQILCQTNFADCRYCLATLLPIFLVCRASCSTQSQLLKRNHGHD